MFGINENFVSCVYELLYTNAGSTDATKEDGRSEQSRKHEFERHLNGLPKSRPQTRERQLQLQNSSCPRGGIIGQVGQ